MIKSIQKVIRIGTSKGVFLPAKDLNRLGISVGDSVEITAKAIKQPSIDHISQEYADFKKQYGETLKNLADR
jgi:antitoxin component of MazEF toxin-antitoxin module